MLFVRLIRRSNDPSLTNEMLHVNAPCLTKICLKHHHAIYIMNKWISNTVAIGTRHKLSWNSQMKSAESGVRPTQIKYLIKNSISNVPVEHAIEPVIIP